MTALQRAEAAPNERRGFIVNAQTRSLIAGRGVGMQTDNAQTITASLRMLATQWLKSREGIEEQRHIGLFGPFRIIHPWYRCHRPQFPLTQ